VTVPLREAIRVWAKIGLLSFGGPAGQIALMHRILVEEKRWISESSFLHALNFCMLLPGPEAQQLATYTGWLMYRIPGGLIAGILFILPGFVVMLGLSYLYVVAGGLTLVEGLFVGLGAAVIAIVVQAIGRIGRRSLKTPLQVGLALGGLVALFVFQVPFPYVVLGAATIGFVAASLGARGEPAERASTDDAVPASPDQARVERAGHAVRVALIFGLLWLGPVVSLIVFLGPDHVFSKIGVFFSKMAVVTAGGAYAVLTYVAQEAVQTHGWLEPGEMLDGLAMAETTPGPLIMVVQFVGFLAAFRDPGSLPPSLAALLGSILTTWVTFVPCFLWIFLGAPHMERIRRNAGLSGALSAVTAAVVGVITNLALWFSIHFLFAETTTIRTLGLAIELPVLASVDPRGLVITLVALALIFRLRASVLTTLAVASALGIASRAI
jgi:chromate transporter